MATLTDTLNVVTNLVPKYDGNAESLGNVIRALTACKDVVSDANRIVLIQVILSRFEGKASQVFTAVPTTIDTIIDSLKQKFSIKTDPQTVIAKLTIMKQKKDFDSFADEIEKLSAKLELAYVENKVPQDVAKTLANKAGIQALVNGAKNEDTRNTVKFSKCENLAKAIQVGSENEDTIESVERTNVFYASRTNYQQHRNNNEYQEDRYR